MNWKGSARTNERFIPVYHQITSQPFLSRSTSRTFFSLIFCGSPITPSFNSLHSIYINHLSQTLQPLYFPSPLFDFSISPSLFPSPSPSPSPLSRNAKKKKKMKTQTLLASTSTLLATTILTTTTLFTNLVSAAPVATTTTSIEARADHDPPSSSSALRRGVPVAELELEFELGTREVKAEANAGASLLEPFVVEGGSASGGNTEDWLIRGRRDE